MQERKAHEAIGCVFWCQIQFFVLILDEFSGCTYLYEIETDIQSNLYKRATLGISQKWLS